MSTNDLTNGFTKCIELLRCRVILHAKFGGKPTELTFPHIVNNSGGKATVGQHNNGVIKCPNTRTSHADVFHSTLYSVRDDPVSDFKRPISKNRQRTEQVTKRIL